MISVSNLFVWGFEGTTVSPALKGLAREHPPAGYILFKRNITDLAQMQNLIRELKDLQPEKVMIGIDEEGGRVRRLPAPFVQYPPAQTWGVLFQKGKNKKIVFEAGRILGAELLKLGINTDFAPVLDVHSNPQNPIIGDRAFSTDPKLAAQIAITFFQGMKASGVMTCGKHFPGHGDTATDSHLTLPTVNRSLAELQKTEFVPFVRAIRENIPMLMTAHVVYPALDPKNPATLSKIILQNLLRKKMKFEGVIISDDFLMKAIAQKHSLAEASLLALEAGCDLLLICEQAEEGGAVVEEVSRAVSKSPALQARVAESLVRVRTFKKKLRS